MKKNVKTLWALVLTLAMVLSTNLVLPAQAAETVDSSLTYELDFSALDNSINEETGKPNFDYRGLKNSARAAANGATISRHFINSDLPLNTTTINGVTALDFNGKNGFMVASDDGSAFGSENISIEMWIYKENTSKSGRLFNLMQERSKGTILEWFYLGAPNNSNSIKLATNGTVHSYKFADYHYVEDWNHVVVTRSFDSTDNSATTTLYSNGELKYTYTNTGLDDFVAPKAIWVGNYDSTNDIGTALASLRVYNKALTLNEVDAKFDAEKADYGVGLRDERMVYELDFSGLKPADTTQGNRGLTGTVRTGKWVGNHVVLEGTPLTVEQKNGVNGLNFNGKNGIKIPSGQNDDGAFISKDLSIEMWIYKKNAEASGHLLQLTAGSETDMQMYYRGGKPTATNKMEIIPNRTAEAEVYTFSDNHYFDDWEHIVLTRTYDADTNATVTTKLYSNGILKETYTNTVDTFVKPKDLMVGNYSGTGDISTLLASFRVYDAVLTPDDVVEKYDLQKETYGVEDRDVCTLDLDFSGLKEGGDGKFKNAITTRGITTSFVYHPDATLTVEEIEGIEALKMNDKDGFLIDSVGGSVFGSKELTIEMWAYKYAGKSTGTLFKLQRDYKNGNKDDGTNLKDETELYFIGKDTLDTAGSLKIMRNMSNQGTIKYSDKFEQDAWQHIVYERTYDDEGTKATTNIYVNGQLALTYPDETVTTPFVTAERLYFGTYNQSSDINAAIASFKVYNKSLTADEIKDKFLKEAPNYNNITYYANNDEIENIDSEMTSVKSSVWVLNAENKAVNMNAFAAVYQDDVLVKVVPDAKTVSANDVWNFDIDIILENITVDENTKIKTFIWTEDGLKPLYVGADQVIDCL